MKHSTLYVMSKNAYLPPKKRTVLSDEWEQRDSSDSSGLGFIHYWNTKTNESVIVFRGTDMSQLNNLLANLWTHLGMLLGRKPNTADRAIQAITEKIKTTIFEDLLKIVRSSFSRNRLYFTGHDLGGALAICTGVHFLLSKENVEEIVAFEVGGCKQALSELISVPKDNSLEDYLQRKGIDITRYLTVFLGPPNFINTCGEHIRNTVVYIPVAMRGDDDGDLFIVYEEKFKHLFRSVMNVLAPLTVVSFFIHYLVMNLAKQENLMALFLLNILSGFSPLISAVERVFATSLSLIGKMLAVNPDVILKNLWSILPKNPLAQLLRNWLADANSDFFLPGMLIIFMGTVYAMTAAQELDRVMKQHQIKAMDNRFSAAPQPDGLPQGAQRMESWPTRTQLTFHCLSSPFRLFQPHATIGGVFLSQTEMQERRNAEIGGFVVKKR
jgi:hypothetical protein